jgi:hypothetical protein
VFYKCLAAVFAACGPPLLIHVVDHLLLRLLKHLVVQHRLIVDHPLKVVLILFVGRIEAIEEGRAS